MLKTILIILAAICFGLAAIKASPRFEMQSAGFCLLTIALFLL